MTGQVESPRPKQDTSWRHIAGRVSAAILGGYTLAYSIGMAAKLLPLAASEAVYLASILQILSFVVTVLWTFTVSAARAWITLLLVSVVLVLWTMLA